MEVLGQIIRKGNGSYYKINHWLLQWFITRRPVTHKHTPDSLIIDYALKTSESLLMEAELKGKREEAKIYR